MLSARACVKAPDRVILICFYFSLSFLCVSFSALISVIILRSASVHLTLYMLMKDMPHTYLFIFFSLSDKLLPFLLSIF